MRKSRDYVFFPNETSDILQNVQMTIVSSYKDILH